MGLFQKLADYLKSTKLEIQNVNWPKRQETVRFTLLILAVSLVVAAYLGFLDFIFIRLLETFIL